MAAGVHQSPPKSLAYEKGLLLKIYDISKHPQEILSPEKSVEIKSVEMRFDAQKVLKFQQLIEKKC